LHCSVNVFSAQYSVRCLQQSLGLQPPTPPVSFEPHDVEPTVSGQMQQPTYRMMNLHTSYGTYEIFFVTFIVYHCNWKSAVT